MIILSHLVRFVKNFFSGFFASRLPPSSLPDSFVIITPIPPFCQYPFRQKLSFLFFSVVFRVHFLSRYSISQIRLPSLYGFICIPILFCICFRYALRLTALSSYYIPAQFPMKSRLTAHTRHNSRQSAYAPFPSLCPYMTLL